MSFNEDLRSLAISHAHYVEQYKTLEVTRILATLRKADREMRALLLDAKTTPLNKVRYEKTLESLFEIQKVYNAKIDETLKKDLKAFGEVEANAQVRAFEKTAKGVLDFESFPFVAPTSQMIYSTIRSSPILMDNATSRMLEPLLKDIGNARLQAIEGSLRYSYTVGETVPEAVKRMFGEGTQAGALDWTRSKAETVARTALNHAASTARDVTYHENEDLVFGYQWVSTLDSRTSPMCRDYDGKVWIFEATDREKYAGKYELLPAEIRPPAHLGCRSTTIPLVRSWQDLGVPIGEAPAGTRASLDGQVPATSTYYDWLKGQSAVVQKKVMGATRYEMWKAGTITPDKFHTVSGQMLTLKELEAQGFDLGKKGEPSRRIRDHISGELQGKSQKMGVLQKDFRLGGKTLSDDDADELVSAIVDWSEVGYGDIREAQRTGEKGSYLNEAKRIEGWLEVAPSFPDGKTVYRGINGDYALGLKNTLKVGDVFGDKAISSFTSDLLRAADFARSKFEEKQVIIQVDGPKVRMTSVRPFVGVMHRNEDEILASSTVAFQVVKIEKRTVEASSGVKRDVTVIRVKVVGVTNG